MSRALVLACILWVAFGIRAAWVSSLLPEGGPVPLRIPFSLLHMDAVGPGWIGENVPLDEDVERQARVTAYIQRNYRKGGLSLWFYVGYVGHWSPGSIHHPDICFPGSGFELVAKGTATIPAPGLSKELRFKEFRWKDPHEGETYTLSTFYYNGKFEPEEWRLRWDSLFGVRYFAIITISGSQTGSLEETRSEYQDVARRAMPLLLEHFRDAEEKHL